MLQKRQMSPQKDHLTVLWGQADPPFCHWEAPVSARSFSTPDNSMQIWAPAAGWDSARRGRSVTGERGGHKMNTKTVERRGASSIWKVQSSDGVSLERPEKVGPGPIPSKPGECWLQSWGFLGPALDRAALQDLFIVVVEVELRALYELRKCSPSEPLSAHYLVFAKERNGHTAVIRATLGPRFLGPESYSLTAVSHEGQGFHFALKSIPAQP